MNADVVAIVAAALEWGVADDDGESIGIYLDRSCHSADDLDRAILDLAKSAGYGGPSDPGSEFLREDADAAVEWLSGEAPEGCAFFVDDNCLYVERAEPS
jgi:hypothetical protein